MSRPKFEHLKTILTSEYWLIVSLCGAFFSFFALERGGVVVFIDASFILLLLNTLLGQYPLKNTPVSCWVALAVCAYLLGTSVLFYPKVSHYRWMANLVRSLCVAFAIHFLSRKKIKNWVKNLFYAVLSIAVSWQVIAYYTFKMPTGTFSNIHYLASFTILALPVIIYSFLFADGWYRFLFIPVAVLDFDLIIKMGSRPAILAITMSVLFVFIFLVKGRQKWIGLSLVFVIAAILYNTRYGGLFAAFKDLVIILPREERVQLWIDSWAMLKDNSLTAWIIGNGIGGFREVFAQYSTIPDYSHHIFPHNYFLEILYDNGIIGAFLVFGGFTLLMISAMKVVKHASRKSSRIFIQCMIIIFLSWLIHTGLTFPFYSKYAQYSLAFILGIFLAILDNPNDRKDGSQAIEIPTRP